MPEAHTCHEVATAPLTLLELGPRAWPYDLALLAFLLIVAYLLRTALMVAAPRSVAVHVLVTSLTMLPAIGLAAVLVRAAIAHPDRAWLDLLLVTPLYLAWASGGVLGRLARPDAEGADIGWLSHGAFVTFGTGIVAALWVG